MAFIITENEEEIRKWIEEKNGTPVIRNRTDNQGQGALAIKFGTNTNPALEEISWQEFFDTFETSHLAFRYDISGEEEGEFCYSFIDKDQMPVQDDQANEMPENDIPIENLYPSAPSEESMVSPDYPGNDATEDKVSL